MLCPHCYRRLKFIEDSDSCYSEFNCQHCSFGYGQYNSSKEELLNLIHDEFHYSRTSRTNDTRTFELKQKFYFSPFLYKERKR